VDKELELLVRSESRKGILRHYGIGNRKGDLKRCAEQRCILVDKSVWIDFRSAPARGDELRRMISDARELAMTGLWRRDPKASRDASRIEHYLYQWEMLEPTWPEHTEMRREFPVGHKGVSLTTIDALIAAIALFFFSFFVFFFFFFFF